MNTPYLESQGYKGELERLGVATRRNDAGELESIRTPHIINMGEKTLRGVDLELDWKPSIFKLADVRLNSSFTYIFDNKVRTFDFDPMRDRGKTWKNTTAISLREGHHYGRIAARVVSSKDADKRRNYAKLPQTAVFDLTYAYSALWDGKISLGVKNILDKRPPVDETGSIVARGDIKGNMRSFSALGRRYFMGYSRTF